MSCSGIIKSRIEVLNKTWLSIGYEVALKKILVCINKALVIYLCKYLEKVSNNWLKKIKES